MLHCYILPKITLHRDDLDKVIHAREKQAQNIQALDRKVIDECKTIDACELRMEDLRTQFLPDLEKFISKGWCSKGFLDLLLEDVSKEEPRLRQQVRDCIQVLNTVPCHAIPCHAIPTLLTFSEKGNSYIIYNTMLKK